MSKYDADEWDRVTDYGWQLDMRRVIADIDARLTALEAQAKPEACECESACKQQDAGSLEQRVRDLECEVESLFAFQRRDHPATRPVVKKTDAGPDFTPEEMGYEPDVKLAPNKHNCPCCGGPVTIEGDGSTHWYRPQPAPVAEPIIGEMGETYVPKEPAPIEPTSRFLVFCESDEAIHTATPAEIAEAAGVTGLLQQRDALLEIAKWLDGVNPVMIRRFIDLHWYCPLCCTQGDDRDKDSVIHKADCPITWARAAIALCEPKVVTG